MLTKAFTWLFGQPEEINGRERCSTYLYRWIVYDGRRGKVYLHKFVGDDWTRDLHDHPKRFVSIGLWGSYLEETPAGKHRYRAPWIRTFPATHQHRLTTPWGTCWTLVIVLKTVREWGFWHEGRFIPWRDYMDGEEADAMKDCP
jgi:hypothetical protein